MNTKIVYSFISGSNDYYLEQLLLSIKSLRKYNPTAFVEVVTDEVTEKNLTGWRKVLRHMVDSINVVSVPQDFDNMKRSRYLKTNLRRIVEGDYLFIDTDTVVCCSLSSIDYYAHDLMMVADCNDTLELRDKSVLERCERIGFYEMSGKPYFNSGVMYVKDTAKCHEFYEQWHSNWLKSVSEGVNFDQPSLNYTNLQFGGIVRELPGIWNCQIFFKGFNCLHKSKIIHYAGGGNSDRISKIYGVINREGIDSKSLKKYIEHPRTSFYMYLTSNNRNIKNRFMILLNIKVNWLYKLIIKTI